MNNQRHREDFIARLARAGVRPDDARKLLRYARTLHRLAEAQCNGDWPADNGGRLVEPCAKCEGLWAPSVLLKGRQCPDCRTEDAVRRLCSKLTGERYNALPPDPDKLHLVSAPAFVPAFSGDPRGCVLKLRIPGDPGDFDGLVGVP